MNANHVLDNQVQASAISNSPGHTGTARLLEAGSLEMQARAAADLPAATAFLQPGTRIYVPSLTGQSADTIRHAVEAIYRHGFEPVPHVAARRVRARAGLRELLSEMVTEFGVRRVMLIAGDVATPLGPYGNSLDLLEDGTLGGCGLKEVGLAGYPEGHPNIDNKLQTEATLLKVEAARAQPGSPAQRIRLPCCVSPACVASMLRARHSVNSASGSHAWPCNPIRSSKFKALRNTCAADQRAKWREYICIVSGGWCARPSGCIRRR